MNFIQYYPEQELGTCLDMRHHTSNPVEKTALCPPNSAIRNPGSNQYGRLGFGYTDPDGIKALSLDSSSVSVHTFPLCSAGSRAVWPIIVGSVLGGVSVAAVAGAAYFLRKHRLARTKVGDTN